MKKQGLIVLMTLCFVTGMGQTTAIPDPNFEQALITAGIDSDATVNGLIATNDALGVQMLDVSSKLIDDLTGISAFVNLEWLNCGNNFLTSLDVSQLSFLEYLHCFGNQLTSLDLTGNTALYYLDCSNNNLSSLNLNQNVNLNSIWCSFNQLTTLNLSPLASLANLVCDNNQLTFLNLDYNYLLIQLVCDSNQLQALSLKNGTNMNFDGAFSALNNPNLTCIEVDDAAWSAANWPSIDSQSSFQEFCPLGNQQHVTSEVFVFPNPAANQLAISAPESSYYEVTTVTGQVVTSGRTGAQIHWIDLSFYPPGNYFVRIKHETGQKTMIFLKS